MKHKNIKRTLEEFIQEANEAHNYKYDYSLSVYKNNSTKLKIICPEHGVFELAPICHINRKQGCPYCSHPVRDTDSFIKEASKKHDGYYDYSHTTYVKSNLKVKIICPKHGEFLLTPNDHLDGCGCPKCKPEKLKNAFTKSVNTFIYQATEIHGNKYNYDKVKYKNLHTPVTISCNIHGDFKQTPASHLFQLAGCPNCILKAQDRLYKKLSLRFPEDKILFEVRKSVVAWLGSLRLDIYFPDYNIAIEYDGRQHFQPIEIFGGEKQFVRLQESDKKKNQLCKENNCKLFRVPYNCTEEQFDDVCLEIENIINSKQ